MVSGVIAPDPKPAIAVTILNTEPGSYTFHVVNDGSVVHALEVEGPLGEVETADLAPGESADLDVDLSEPGDYEMYCPVDGHKDEGMEGTISVGGGGGGADCTYTTCVL